MPTINGYCDSKFKEIENILRNSIECGYEIGASVAVSHNKDMIVAADTAGAAKMVSELNQKEDAAIASELAAKTYSLDILQNNFQDSEKNVTRFLIMSNNLNTTDSNDDDLMTTLVFELKSIPAALYKALGGLASNGVNMTKLESYINPQGFDVAQFYTDIEGHPENQKVKLALEEMKYYCKHVDILGVYKMSNFRKK